MAPPNRGVDRAVPPHTRPASRSTPTAVVTAATSPSIPSSTNIIGSTINEPPSRSMGSFPSVTIPYPTSSTGSLERGSGAYQDQSYNGSLYIGFNPYLAPEAALATEQAYTSTIFPNQTDFSSLSPFQSPASLSPQSYLPDPVGTLGPLFQKDQQHNTTPIEDQQQQSMYGHPSSSGYSSSSHSRQTSQDMNYNFGGEDRYSTPHLSMPRGSLGPHLSLPTASTNATSQPPYMFTNDSAVYSTGSSGSDQEMECDPSSYVFHFNSDLPVSSAPSPQNLDESFEPNESSSSSSTTTYPYGTQPIPTKSPSPFQSDQKSSHRLSMSTTMNITSSSSSSSSSSKEKEQNKQKLYRNRKSEFTNRMRDELLSMNLLPHNRITHAPEIMSKTADTLRDYRELLILIKDSVDGMPENLAAVPGAVRKRLSENRALFNGTKHHHQQHQHARGPAPILPAAVASQQQQQQHHSKGDYKHNVQPIQPMPFRATTGHPIQSSTF